MRSKTAASARVHRDITHQLLLLQRRLEPRVQDRRPPAEEHEGEPTRMGTCAKLTHGQAARALPLIIP